MFEGIPENLGNSQLEGLSMNLCIKSGRASMGASAVVGCLAFRTALVWDFTKTPPANAPFDFGGSALGSRTGL
jgi:hypothetical protein